MYVGRIGTVGGCVVGLMTITSMFFLVVVVVVVVFTGCGTGLDAQKSTTRDTIMTSTSRASPPASHQIQERDRFGGRLAFKDDSGSSSLGG